MIWPIRLMKSFPPWGRALAMSRSCKVTSCTIYFFLWTSPFGRGTYYSAQRSNSLAQASHRPTRFTLPVEASMYITSPIAHFSLVRFSCMEGSSLSCLVPLEVLRVIMTLMTILLPEARSSLSQVFSSVISPSHTYFVYLIFMPIDLLKFYISTSVFFTSDEKTSEATIGQNGTFGPSSWAMANAMAVFPVPGGPARSKALPAIFLDLIKSTTTPAASLANTCPTIPCEISLASPSSFSPRPLICVCVEIRCALVVERTSSICINPDLPLVELPLILNKFKNEGIIHINNKWLIYHMDDLFLGLRDLQPLITPLWLQQQDKALLMERLEKIKEDFVGGKTGDKFQFTTDQGCLSIQQRTFYEENGYLIVRNFLKEDDIQRWKARFLQYCNATIPPSPGMQIVRDISLVKKHKDTKRTGQENITKVQDFQFDPILHSYCTNPDLIPYLKSFCGDNIKSIHTIFLNKPPGMGSSSRHPFHQDLAYFPMKPANRIVAAWAALEDSTKENGGLNIYPFTHKGKFYEHGYPNWNGQVNKAYFGINEYDKFQSQQRIDLEMKKGDIVFFHPLLIHGSSQNKTQGFRKSICCHFASSQCEFTPLQGTIQGQVGREVMSYMVKKIPHLTDYYSFWRYKCALVAGKSFEGRI